MRLLVRYTIPKYNKHGLAGIDLPDYDFMSAADIQCAIEAGICDQYNNVSDDEIRIDVIEYLGTRQTKANSPQPILNTAKSCLACGGDHGNNGLPCPNTTPHSYRVL